jgi:RNA polymerase sigma factor (sigma-70 family)
MTTPPTSADLLCPVRGKQIEQAWALHHQGDERAFLDLVGSIYDWLDQRVTAILRGYRGLDLPADEVLSDHVIDRVARSLARHPAASCDDFVRLVSGEIRWAIRSILRDRAAEAARSPSLETVVSDEGEDGWVADPRSANPLEGLLAREEGVRFAEARARFDAAAAALPEPLRQTFCLRFYAGLPVEEVAARMQVTDRTVRDRVRAALDAVSRELTGKPYPGKPPQFKGTGSADEASERCRPCDEKARGAS